MATLHQCDCCKQVYPTKAGFLTLTTSVYPPTNLTSMDLKLGIPTQLHLEICSPCALAKGILRKKDGTEAPPAPTIEDLLYDRIAEVVEEAVESAMASR